jgi:hypothetical protein
VSYIFMEESFGLSSISYIFFEETPRYFYCRLSFVSYIFIEDTPRDFCIVFYEF